MSCFSCGRRPHESCPRHNGCPYADYPAYQRMTELINLWQARMNWLRGTARLGYETGRDGEAIRMESIADIYEQVVEELRRAISTERRR